MLQLIEGGMLGQHLMALSPYFERHRGEYVRSLREVSQTGDFDSWIRFFAGAIHEEAHKALDRVQRLLALKDDMLRSLRSQGIRGVATQITEDLIGYPVISITPTAARYNLSYQAVNTAMARLANLGFVSEITGGNYGRLFAARSVLAVLES